jgi:hypothetical protein
MSMIADVERQLAVLMQAAEQSGEANAVDDHVKRHLRIMRQRPDIGRLALSIANLTASIVDWQEGQARGEVLAPKELQETVEMMEKTLATRDERIAQAQQAAQPNQPESNP